MRTKSKVTERNGEAKVAKKSRRTKVVKEPRKSRLAERLASEIGGPLVPSAELSSVVENLGESIPSVKQILFLRAFTTVGTITGAARIAGCSPTSHTKWLREDAKYGERFELARTEAIENLETELYERAKAGTSDSSSAALLMFALKALRPTVYRENQRVEVVGRDGGPIEHTLAVELTDEQLERIAASSEVIEGEFGPADPS